MTENVTDIIVARTRKAESLRPMVVWSIVGHVALVALIVVLQIVRPSGQEPPRTVMTISLGGAPGPRTGGLTPIGARAVQAPTPPEPTRQPETAPAPAAPPMTLPDPKARPRTERRPTQAPEDATGRRANTGADPREGSANVETNVRRGQGFGLSSSGGAGASVQLDVSDFCCPEYLEQMVTLIRRNWQQNQGVVGTTGVRCTILRDGTIQNIQVERPSGFVLLDNAATRALQLTKLPPLPAQFGNPTLTVHFTFDFER